jgi:DNA-binding response OmpR family regulator
MFVAAEPWRELKRMVQRERQTILIVEKQPNYTQLLVKQVLFAGFRPLVAVTGEGGIRKAIEHHPDLILLELDLTDMDGLEFVSLLRDEPQLQKTPIVAMSIFSYLKSPALFGGCDDFLQKPVKMIELMGHIRHLLQEAPVAGKMSKTGSQPARSAFS